MPAVAAAVMVGGAAGFAYSVLRTQTMDGLDSRGTWISVELPLDAYALATVVILAATVGLIVAGHPPSMTRHKLAQLRTEMPTLSRPAESTPQNGSDEVGAADDS
jgi:hypothetical protein